MAKPDEINYINKVAEIENVSVDSFRDYLANKPYSDPRCSDYLMDLAQIMHLIPPPPARLLDIGVGSGWTSEFFARRGYEVLGLDISPDMIDLANRRAGPNLSFETCDYESGSVPKGYDIAIIYDALHHAENTAAVLRNVHDALVDGGVLLTIEPGAGHSTTADSIEVMRKFGTTEKDMPASLQRELMRKAGFGTVRQYLRLSQLPMENIGTLSGSLDQVRHNVSLAYESANGMTSIVVAVKSADGESSDVPTAKISGALLQLASAVDRQRGAA
jgi:SAM-dependent methyltransferase